MSGTSQASGPDNLSTKAGGRSLVSSDVPNSSSWLLTSNLINSEDPSASAYDEYTADENMSDYDGENEAVSSETQYRGTHQREERVAYNNRNIHIWLNFSKNEKKTKHSWQPTIYRKTWQYKHSGMKLSHFFQYT